MHTKNDTYKHLEKEIRGANIDMVDNGDNPDAPAPREMIDLEVPIHSFIHPSLFIYPFLSIYPSIYPFIHPSIYPSIHPPTTNQATFEKLENEVREIGSNKEALRRNFVDLTELKEVLKNAQTFFDEVCGL